jgi:hypothetical protein
MTTADSARDKRRGEFYKVGYSFWTVLLRGIATEKNAQAGH